MAIDPATHYDEITDMWKEIMGDNFHFGYFEIEDMDLPQAARTMVEKLLEPCDVNEESRILDVGCGIGGPAFYIHERYHCAIDGISTSVRGVETANQVSREKGYDKVRFKVADGMRNGFPNNTFDVVWIMEASHTIPDKIALFRECHRVLRKGGRLVMCDLAQLRAHPRKGLWRILSDIKRRVSPTSVWGPVYIPTTGYLYDQLMEAGFAEVRAVDISKKVIPTLRHWTNNAVRYRDGVTSESARQSADEFINGCAVLESAYRDGAMKYVMLFTLKES